MFSAGTGRAISLHGPLWRKNRAREVKLSSSGAPATPLPGYHRWRGHTHTHTLPEMHTHPRHTHTHPPGTHSETHTLTHRQTHTLSHTHTHPRHTLTDAHRHTETLRATQRHGNTLCTHNLTQAHTQTHHLGSLRHTHTGRLRDTQTHGHQTSHTQTHTHSHTLAVSHQGKPPRQGPVRIPGAFALDSNRTITKSPHTPASGRPIPRCHRPTHTTLVSLF